MRIIAGKFRGRKIHPPRDVDPTRPITDRLKQSLFDRLTAMHLLGGYVLDLFSGTGSLGLEALSRDADHCTFVEQNCRVRTVLEQNLASLGLSDRATVLNADALKLGWLDRLTTAETARVAFCDPPYRLMNHEAGATRIAGLIEAVASVMEPAGLLVLRSDHRTSPPIVSRWQGAAESYVYGSMALHFYRAP